MYLVIDLKKRNSYTSLTCCFVFVRMELECQLSVRFLQVSIAYRSRHSQYFIVVTAVLDFFNCFRLFGRFFFAISGRLCFLLSVIFIVWTARLIIGAIRVLKKNINNIIIIILLLNKIIKVME